MPNSHYDINFGKEMASLVSFFDGRFEDLSELRDHNDPTLKQYGTHMD